MTKSRFVHIFAAGAAAAASAVFVTPAAHAATDTTLTYECTFPFLGAYHVTTTWHSPTPAIGPVGSEIPLGPLPVTIGMPTDFGQAMGVLDAGSVSGSAAHELGLKLGYLDALIDAHADFPATPVSPTSAFEIPTVIDLIPVQLDEPGHGELSAGNFTLHVTFYRADGSPVQWPGANEDKSIDVPCVLDAGQDPTVASFDVVANQEPVLGTATASVSKPVVKAGGSVWASVDFDLADGSSPRGERAVVVVDGHQVDTVRLGRDGRASTRVDFGQPGVHTVQFVGLGDLAGIESNEASVTVVKRRHY